MEGGVRVYFLVALFSPGLTQLMWVHTKRKRGREAPM